MKKIGLLGTLICLLFCPAFTQGNWEVDIHFSTWSIDLLKPLIEENLTPEFDNYNPDKGMFSFDSSGSNYGLAVRYFPKGKNGSFSIGFSYERNNFIANIKGSYNDTDDDSIPIEVSGEGTFELLPHSVNLNLRWELWPTNRVHPFIGFGLGFGPTHGEITISGSIVYPDGSKPNENFSEKMTIEEALEESADEGTSELSLIPILHLYIGVRGEVTKNVYLIGEFGIYNGISLRGGLAFRF